MSTYVCEAQKSQLDQSSLKEGIDYHQVRFFFIIEVLYLFIILLAASVSSISVIVAILRVPALRHNMNNILVLNIIAMDINTTAWSVPFSLVDLFLPGYLYCYPRLCKVHGFFALLGCFGNFSAIVVISIYRCVNIVYDKKFRWKRRHIAIMIVSSWIFASVVVLPPVTGTASTHAYTRTTHHCSPSWEDSCTFYTICICIIYIISIPTLIICYALIQKTVNKSAERVEQYRRGSQGQHGNGYHPGNHDSTPGNHDEADLERTLSKESVENGSYRRTSVAEETPSSVAAKAPSPVVTKTPSITEDLTRLKTISLHRYNSLSTVAERTVEAGQIKRVHSKLRITRSRALKSLAFIRRQRSEKRVAITGMLLVLTSTVCWTPYFIVHSCRLNIHPTHALYIFAMWLAYTNAALDPILYTVLNKKIRTTVLSQFRFPCRMVISVLGMARRS